MKADIQVNLARLDVRVYRVPVERPVHTAFGRMRNRPAVFVRLEDSDGAFGWGEVFCNWPVSGAEHRARLLVEDMADLVLGSRCDTPRDLFCRLEAATRIRALQSGEEGPFAQVIAGLDMALHDLLARRAGQPLHRYLHPDAATHVPVYASGIHVEDGMSARDAARAKGLSAVKVKIGFDLDRDIALVRELLDSKGAGERLMADANQVWTPEQARTFLSGVAGGGLDWIEEPIRADRDAEDWVGLARTGHVPLAAGENICGGDAFDAVLDASYLSYLQPDISKWGGFTGGLDVAGKAADAGVVLCVHYLGGGIGLAASAAYLAVAGGEGLLELDVNPNPLRDAILGDAAACVGGRYRLGEAPGLGIEDVPAELDEYRTLSLECSV